jgi:hypothetical protein
MTEELERHNAFDITRPKEERSGPLTAIIWPATVQVKGKVFKVKGGKVVRS